MSLKSNNQSTESAEAKPATSTAKKSLWLKLAKGALWTVGGIVLALIVICSSIVWTLNPDRLTPLVEKVASDNLNAQVKLKRAELTFWSSFPRLKLEVDGLEVISHALDTLPAAERAALPADADSLLSIGHFGGSVNLIKLIGGKISLSNVLIDRPAINLLQVNDSVANFNIVPPSEPDTTTSTIPDIYIDHFAITNAKPWRYRSLPDTLDVAVTLKTISLDDEGVPLYELNIDSNVDTPLLKEYDLDKTQINLNAGISWSGSDPNRVGIKDLIFKHKAMDVIVNTDIDFTDDLRLDALDVKVNNIDIDYLQKHLPAELREQLTPLQTNMKINASARLLKPLTIGDSISTPFVALGLEVPPCQIKYEDADIQNFNTTIEGNYIGNNINASTIDIKEFCVQNDAADFDITGQLTNLMDDPHFDGTFEGVINFGKLSEVVHHLIGADISGVLKAKTEIRAHLSDLNADDIQCLYADGTMTLDNVRFKTHDATTGGYIHHALLNFGANKSKTAGKNVIDSMLMTRLQIDTASIYSTGLEASVRKFDIGMGAQNFKSVGDTTQINPISGRMSIGSLRYNSELDSMKFSLTNAKGRASLQRYRGHAKVPELTVNINSERMRVAGNAFSTSLRETNIDFTAHVNPRKHNKAKGEANGRGQGNRERRDGDRQRKAMTKEALDSVGVETIDLDIDNSLRSLLRRWDMDGCITVKKGRLRLPGINLRNSFKNLDFDFTSDSIMLTSLDYRIGRSDLSVTGKVANIRRALSRKAPAPLRIDLDVKSDTLNVNQIIQAITSADDENMLNDDTWEAREDQLVEATELNTDTVKPILVPINIDASFTLDAKNVIYTDMLFHNLRGKLMMYQGSLVLRDFAADTEAGGIGINAIYTAPTAKEMQFGVGMLLNNFHIDKVNKMVPGVDSILPMLNYFSGKVNVDIAATSNIQPNMDLDMESVRAALHFRGDSLVVFDNQTFHTLAKWLLFKDKSRNLIDSLNVEITVANGLVQIYPFELNIDRYRLGVMGSNDMNFNLNYHVSILKSPVPFKFGINLKGTLDKPKIRFGGAKFKNKNLAVQRAIADTTRINLVSEMRRAFRRGIRAARLSPLDIKGNTSTSFMNEEDEQISHADSLLMIEQGYIEAPDTLKVAQPQTDKKSKKKKK